MLYTKVDPPSMISISNHWYRIYTDLGQVNFSPFFLRGGFYFCQKNKTTLLWTVFSRKIWDNSFLFGGVLGYKYSSLGLWKKSSRFSDFCIFVMHEWFQDSRLKVFIWPFFTFFQITYKQLHKFLIYKVKETSIKTTCGRWHGSHL